jgi:NAD(P)-dependent dehydrogenase (short-subunit alcohol dehydrogenase family)
MTWPEATSSAANNVVVKVWFITGMSRGFGREFARSALERDDRVAATARTTTSLDGVVTTYGNVLPCHAAIGRLDVVVNNAGYSLFGMVEELTEQQLRAQLETNLFGAFFVTQAVLPILRVQGSGHLIQISTIGGIAAFPSLGAYHASKWPWRASASP